MAKDDLNCSNPNCGLGEAYEVVKCELEAERKARSKLVKYAVEKDRRIGSLRGEILGCVLGRNNHAETRELIAWLEHDSRGQIPPH